MSRNLHGRVHVHFSGKTSSPPGKDGDILFGLALVKSDARESEQLCLRACQQCCSVPTCSVCEQLVEHHAGGRQSLLFTRVPALGTSLCCARRRAPARELAGEQDGGELAPPIAEEALVPAVPVVQVVQGQRPALQPVPDGAEDHNARRVRLRRCSLFGSIADRKCEGARQQVAEADAPRIRSLPDTSTCGEGLC